MKFTTLILALLLAVSAYAATPQAELFPPITQSSVQEYIGGEHTPLHWTGRVELRNSVTSTTEWIQVGRANAATLADNDRITRHNPEIFTLDMNCRWARKAADSTWLADSAYVRNVWWEHRWDTTASSSSLNSEVRRDAWALDSSNYCVKYGAYSSPLYGIWQFESFNDTTKTWQVPVRWFEGGYYRLNFASTSTDTFYVDYRITGEN